LPGVIEIDVLDSFKMLCRRLQRIVEDTSGSNYSTDIATEKLHSRTNQTN
jgi:hypothetical protein